MKERCKLVACIKCNRRKESRKGDLGFRDYAMKCMQRNQVRGVVDNNNNNSNNKRKRMKCKITRDFKCGIA